MAQRIEGRHIKTPYPNEVVQGLLFQQVKGNFLEERGISRPSWGTEEFSG